MQKIIDTRSFFRKVYGWMFLGLIVTGTTSYLLSSNATLYHKIADNTLILLSIFGIELALVILFTAYVEHISSTVAVALFFLYCILVGITFSSIFLLFDLKSIGLVFFISALMFGSMSAYGYFAQDDFAGLEKILLMGLFGLIVASLVHFISQNSQSEFFLSFIGILLFTGMTIYDTQKIKKLNRLDNAGTPEETKETILGAMHLYLDFVNVFYRIARFVGRPNRPKVELLRDFYR